MRQKAFGFSEVQKPTRISADKSVRGRVCVCVCHSLTVSQKWLVPINKHMLVLISWRIRKQLTLTLGAACVHCAVMLSLWELLKSTAGPWVSERVRTCGELLAAAADRATVDTTQSSSRQAADLLGPKASKLPSEQNSSEPQMTRVWQGYKYAWRVKLALLRLQSAKQREGTRLALSKAKPT